MSSTPTGHPTGEIPLAIIAGGLGMRMGGPKHSLKLKGQPILQHVLERVEWEGPTILVLGHDQADPDGAALFETVVRDAVANNGPVQGVLTGLLAARKWVERETQVLILPVDMPAIERSHLKWLSDFARSHDKSNGVMLRHAFGGARTSGVIEPFPCVLSTRAIADLEAFLAKGQRALHQLSTLPGVLMADAPAEWLDGLWTNLNTPGDVADYLSSDTTREEAEPSADFAEACQTRVPVMRWNGHLATASLDDVAAEEPLEIRVRGRSVAVTMRTPGEAAHDAELATGFLLTEGVIKRAEEILHIEHCGRNEAGNVLDVRLAPLMQVDFEQLTRHVFTASSCGLCGKASIEAIAGTHPAIADVERPVQVDAKILLEGARQMRELQATFDRTGGLHAAALLDESGKLLVVREDIGRHNAVDKVIGFGLRNQVDLTRAILLVSGRSSFEIMQKSVAARIPIVAAVSAPSSLAVAFAARMNQTLVGFLRDRRMNVYTHGERIVFGAAEMETSRHSGGDVRGVSS